MESARAAEPGLLVRQLMAMWESGDTAALEAITTEDVVYDDVPNDTRFEGREGVRRYIGHVQSWASQIEIAMTAVHAGPDSALAEWIMRGVQHRPIPGRVTVATGRTFTLPGATLVEVREDRIVDCFRNGGGVPYEEFPRFHAVMADDSGQSVLAALESHILPLVPGLAERLASGIRVLDVGCGSGRIMNRLADLFPLSRRLST